MTLLEKKLDTAVTKNTLFHGKALLVIATRDTNNVALRNTKGTPSYSQQIGMITLFHIIPSIHLQESLLPFQ